jgi:hypothetical protein
MAAARIGKFAVRQLLLLLLLSLLFRGIPTADRRIPIMVIISGGSSTTGD